MQELNLVCSLLPSFPVQYLVRDRLFVTHNINIVYWYNNVTPYLSVKMSFFWMWSRKSWIQKRAMWSSKNVMWHPIISHLIGCYCWIRQISKDSYPLFFLNAMKLLCSLKYFEKLKANQRDETFGLGSQRIKWGGGASDVYWGYLPCFTLLCLWIHACPVRFCPILAPLCQWCVTPSRVKVAIFKPGKTQVKINVYFWSHYVLGNKSGTNSFSPDLM